MDDHARLLVEIWEAMKDFLASGSLNDAARVLVSAFVNQGIDLDELEDAAGECPYLERAIDGLKPEEDEGIDEDEEERW